MTMEKAMFDTWSPLPSPNAGSHLLVGLTGHVAGCGAVSDRQAIVG